MADPFEAYSDLDEVAERLNSADAGERRVAVMELGHAGAPAAIRLLAGMLGGPDAGVHRQTALALGEYDGLDAAEAIAVALVDADSAVAAAAADSAAELKKPASASSDSTISVGNLESCLLGKIVLNRGKRAVDRPTVCSSCAGLRPRKKTA